MHSIYIYTSRKVDLLPCPIYNTSINSARESTNFLHAMIHLLPLQYIQILLVFDNQVGSIRKTLVRALMAHQKDSKLEADAVESNAIAARLYGSSARKPNPPVRSAWILAYQKQAFTSARAMSIISVG